MMFKYKFICCFFIFIMLFSPCASGKSSAISKAPEQDIYCKYPKIKFSGRIFVIKKSYYSKLSNDYTNEYFPVKESKIPGNEKIIVENFIQEKNPVHYAYNEASKYKDGVVVYQKKFERAIISYSGVSGGDTVTLKKIELNPYAPGLQITSFVYNQNTKTQLKNKATEEHQKYIKDKYVLYLLELKTPKLCRFNLNIR